MKIRKYQNITSLNIQQKLKPKIKDEVEQNEQDVWRLARRN